MNKTPLEGRAGFEPATFGCAGRCASGSTSRPDRRLEDGISECKFLHSQTLGFMVDQSMLVGISITDDQLTGQLFHHYPFGGIQASRLDRSLLATAWSCVLLGHLTPPCGRCLQPGQ